jgi:cob(I)alamin adenosyltransferase
MTQPITQIKEDQITGYEAAIANYTKAIAELQEFAGHWFINFLIGEYREIIEILEAELKEMKQRKLEQIEESILMGNEECGNYYQIQELQEEAAKIKQELKDIQHGRN